MFARRRRRGARADEALERHRAEVLIVGAGYAGLAAGRVLAAAGVDVRILEARSRAGGRTLNEDVVTGRRNVATDDVIALGGRRRSTRPRAGSSRRSSLRAPSTAAQRGRNESLRIVVETSAGRAYTTSDAGVASAWPPAARETRWHAHEQRNTPPEWSSGSSRACSWFFFIFFFELFIAYDRHEHMSKLVTICDFLSVLPIMSLVVEWSGAKGDNSEKLPSWPSSAPRGHLDINGVSQFTEDPLSFLEAFYFVIITFTTVGYGDIYPQQQIISGIVAHRRRRRADHRVADLRPVAARVAVRDRGRIHTHGDWHHIVVVGELGANDELGRCPSRAAAAPPAPATVRERVLQHPYYSERVNARELPRAGGAGEAKVRDDEARDRRRPHAEPRSEGGSDGGGAPSPWARAAQAAMAEACNLETWTEAALSATSARTATRESDGARSRFEAITFYEPDADGPPPALDLQDGPSQRRRQRLPQQRRAALHAHAICSWRDDGLLYHERLRDGIVRESCHISLADIPPRSRRSATKFFDYCNAQRRCPSASCACPTRDRSLPYVYTTPRPRLRPRWRQGRATSVWFGEHGGESIKHDEEELEACVKVATRRGSAVFPPPSDAKDPHAARGPRARRGPRPGRRRAARALEAGGREWLKEDGSDINGFDEDGWTLLTNAAWKAILDDDWDHSDSAPATPLIRKISESGVRIAARHGPALVAAASFASTQSCFAASRR
ncbi:large conductance calcium-activated potassium channel [Aureococcus anophagefferens]|nr:large conductance calcium-activated potassium channel [Aureococcus anophagefferens]